MLLVIHVSSECEYIQRKIHMHAHTHTETETERVRNWNRLKQRSMEPFRALNATIIVY